MKDTEKITDDIYFIKQPIREDWFVGIIVILGTSKIGLVDTGFENTPQEYILPLVEELVATLKI